ncbi:lipopolysaccharide biosynthesis protein [Marinirhabdus gelatinilytica]|uniref:O-antigen/teichoic acid export membrane protein n=1 Tax=Marinirhabdus gelatinilytica TaxID=1703343 RepID=A0A370QJH6_9FLAO|nr:oligosaccharide flippase family protein [Marinirhabdus gelatinilytica]RDK88518.1 O-antigen/teichoic acid export membrane protein [Marinirhabdus gelatinilytica]
MEKKQGKLARNAAIYSIFSLLQRGLGFFLLPVYTTVLATEQLGIISTATAVISFLVLLFGLSFRGSTAYYYYEYKDENLPYLKKLYGTSVVFVILCSLGGIVLLLLTKHWVLNTLFENIPFYPYVLLALASIFLQPLYFYYQSILKAKQKAKRASFLDFVYFAVMIGLTLVLILGFNFRAEGALLANAVASLLVFCISVVGLWEEITLCFVPAILKKVLKYSLPLLPHNLSGWAMNMVDRVMLNAINSLSVVALFDVGSQIGKVVNMISLGVNSAYAPWFFDQVKNNANSKKNIVSVTEKIVILYTVVAVCVSWIAPELLQLISKPAYHESWTVTPLIAMAFVINGFYFTFSSVFFLEKTKYLPFLTLSGAAVNIALNYFLIQEYGFMGAAIASLCTKIFFTALTYYFSQSIFYIPYNLKVILLVIATGGALSSLPYIIQPYIIGYNLLLVTGIKLLILAIFGGYFAFKNLQTIKSYLKPNNGP